jgi:hypothetical protein
MEMKETFVRLCAGILVFLVCVGFAIVLILGHKENVKYREQIISENYERGYLDACKDFYKGKLKYDLIENEDGSRVWKKVK